MSELTGLNPREQFLAKFDDPATTLEQVLQWETLVEEYKQGEAKVHKFINSHIQRLIQIMTIEGPANDELRSFLFPRVACDLLSSGHEAMNLLLLTPTNPNLNSEPLHSVLDYFQGTPNLILSGYVSKVLISIYEHQPFKTQDYIFRRKYAQQMIKFASSRSVADFIVSLIAIQDDRILTYYLTERNDFLNLIADTYAQGELGQDELSHLGMALCQIITTLWSEKCLEAAEFSRTIFRISQLVLDNTNDLIRHNSDLLPLVIQKFVQKGSETPFILKLCASRILCYLSQYQPEIWTSPSGKQTYRFSKQNLQLLGALSSIVTTNYPLVASLFNKNGGFGLLLNLVERYQLNNMVHIEVQKIFKAALKSDSPKAFSGITETGAVLQKIDQMVFSVESPGQVSKKAYMGSMINILQCLGDSINTSPLFGQLKKSHPEFVATLSQYLNDKISKRSINLGDCKLKLDYSIPEYDQSTLQQKFKGFFQAQKIEKDPRQMQNRYTLSEISNECEINKQWGQMSDQTRIH